MSDDLVDVEDAAELEADGDDAGDGRHSDIDTMSLHGLRAALRAARRRDDAHELERQTFIRHIERLRAAEVERDDRERTPLRCAEAALRNARVRIAELEKRLSRCRLERAQFKMRADSLARSRTTKDTR